MPANEVRFVFVAPNASSCIFALPRTIAPASTSRCSVGAFSMGWTCASAGVAPVVGKSFVLILSFTTMGRPAKAGSAAPRARSSSIRFAAAIAPVLSRTIKLFNAASRSARALSVSTYSTADKRPVRIASTASVAVSWTCASADSGFVSNIVQPLRLKPMALTATANPAPLWSPSSFRVARATAVLRRRRAETLVIFIRKVT